MRRLLAGALAAAVLVASAACGITDPSDNRVQDFAGVLEVGGGATHEFSAGRNGEFNIKVTALSPSSNVFVGVAFGQVISGVCNLFPLYTNNFAQVGRTAVSGAISRGTYCAAIFDVGTFTERQTYTLQISYPE